MFAPKGANSPPARRSRAIRIHFGGDGGKRQPSGLLPPKVAKRPEGVNRNERRTRPAAVATIEVADLRPSKPLTAGAGGRPGVASGAVRRGAFLASEGRSKRLRAACRASPAPMAQAVGAGTRLPRQERAHDGHILGYTVPNATRHAIPHHNAHIYPRIYRATHRHKPPPPAPSRVSRILWTLETLARSRAGAAPPPMAQAAGAAIRRGPFAGQCKKHAPTASAAACPKPRFLLPSVARNAHSSASRPHPFAAKAAHATASGQRAGTL